MFLGKVSIGLLLDDEDVDLGVELRELATDDGTVGLGHMGGVYVCVRSFCWRYIDRLNLLVFGLF